jgi:hypothetical protein
MRSLPVQYGTIQIASVGGELRHVNVSGLAKAHLLWLFRNFSILECSVLNQKQQQLIAQVWQAGASAASVDAPVELIGTIEGFSPQLYQPPVDPPPVAATKPRHHVRFGLSGGWRISAIGTAVGVLLLGCAIGMGARFRLPETHIATVAAANPVSSTVTLLAPTSAESAPSVADVPAAATEASSAPAFYPPDAMAQDASSATVMSPEPRVAASTNIVSTTVASSTVSTKVISTKVSGKDINTKAPGKPEVMIRVSVDGEGRAQGFQVVSGDQKKTAAALAAAKRWSFQPCASSAECEHLLKFTDYGGASRVQMID